MMTNIKYGTRFREYEEGEIYTIRFKLIELKPKRIQLYRGFSKHVCDWDYNDALYLLNRGTWKLVK